MDNKTNIKNLPIADQIGGTDLVLVSVNGKARRALASLLKGQKGDDVELQITNTHIQWRLIGGEWKDLISYDELRGPLQDAANECISATNDLRELETNVLENEQTRITSEISRNNEEKDRDMSENERVQAEKERIAAEILRKTAENERVISENNRITAENDRVSEISNLRDNIEKATENANIATEDANKATADLRKVEKSCLLATDNANAATINANDAAQEARDFIDDANRVTVTESDKLNWNDKYTRKETAAEITKHNESGTAHSDIRNSITNILNGNSIVKKAEYTQKLGSEKDSYTKSTLDAKINKHIKSVDYNSINAVFTFTFEDGTTKQIDTPVENTVKDGRLDSATNEVVLVLISGQEIRIPAYKLVKVYSGQTTATTDTSVSAEGKISVDLRQGVIDTVHLSQTLQNAIASHQTKTGDTANNVASFSDQTTRTNLSSGDKHSVLFGKIKKWFADLKAVAFSGKASDLSEDAIHRFVTDTEKADWNSKAAENHNHDSAYAAKIHTHTADQISDTDTKVIMTSKERSKLADIEYRNLIPDLRVKTHEKSILVCHNNLPDCFHNPRIVMLRLKKVNRNKGYKIAKSWRWGEIRHLPIAFGGTTPTDFYTFKLKNDNGWYELQHNDNTYANIDNLTKGFIIRTKDPSKATYTVSFCTGQHRYAAINKEFMRSGIFALAIRVDNPNFPPQSNGRPNGSEYIYNGIPRYLYSDLAKFNLTIHYCLNDKFYYSMKLM